MLFMCEKKRKTEEINWEIIYNNGLFIYWHTQHIIILGYIGIKIFIMTIPVAVWN